MTIKLYTIGFTKKTADKFFRLLEDNAVKKIIDIRINNTSQLAGFAKGVDLEFFAKKILAIPYVYRPDLAPTKDLLKRYRENATPWSEYEEEFLKLMQDRDILTSIESTDLDGAVLLCSEDQPDECHRRLLAEYLQEKYPEISIFHLR